MDQPLNQPSNQRKISGLVVDRSRQFKLAISCASLILLPSLILNVTLMTNVAMESVRLAETGTSAARISQILVATTLRYAVVSIAVYLCLAALSVFALLKFTNRIIGPVARLETFVEGLIAGQSSSKTNLRKDDYLKPLGEALDRLAAKLNSTGTSD